jgi:hypothetical protein
MTFVSPWFGLLYGTACCAAVVSLMAASRLGRGTAVLAGYALVAASLIGGLAIRGLHDDVSGEPLTFVPALATAVFGPTLPAADGVDHEISVDTFAPASAPHGAAKQLVLHRSDIAIIEGWAFDPADHARCSGVAAVVARRAFAGSYGNDRPDVANVYGSDHRFTGYRIVIPAASLNRGRSLVEVRCLGQAQRTFVSPATLSLEVLR